MTAIDATDDEVIAAWDAGRPIWSVSMGGMGAGHEQCIQIVGFEMWRAMRDAPPESWDKFDDDRDAWKSYMDQIEKAPTVNAAIEKLGPSGAQFTAAMNLASVFARNGYAKGIAKAPADRHIQCSKNSPALLSDFGDQLTATS